MPLLAELTPPEAPLRLLRDLLRAHGITPTNRARSTFKSFAEDAISTNREEQYLGHASQGLSGLCSRVQLRA